MVTLEEFIENFNCGKAVTAKKLVQRHLEAYAKSVNRNRDLVRLCRENYGKSLDLLSHDLSTEHFREIITDCATYLTGESYSTKIQLNICNHNVFNCPECSENIQTLLGLMIDYFDQEKSLDDNPFLL